MVVAAAADYSAVEAIWVAAMAVTVARPAAEADCWPAWGQVAAATRMAALAMAALSQVTPMVPMFAGVG